MRKLPEFQGYTVDVRLHEFRKAGRGKQLEFVSFESQAGRALITAMRSAGIKLETPYRE
jgi:hypothetical protein